MTAAGARVTPGGHARREGPAAAHARRVVAMPARIASRARHIVVATLVGAAAVLLYGPGYLSYDAGWALLWGNQLAAGHLPTFEAVGAPTPHPLANAAAALLSVLGDDSGAVFVALGPLAFGFLAWAGYLLGARLLDPLAGGLFAVFLFTRPRLIALQAQAPIDVPFLAFLLLAAAIAVRRPHRSGAILACLTLAGLLRPEAWLFTTAYVGYLLLTDPGAHRLRVLLVAAIAPCTWALFDLAVTGDPLHSLHSTQALAEDVGRPRGLGTAIEAIPAAYVDFLGSPVALAGVTGAIVALVALRRSAMIPAAMLGLGIVAFAAIGAGGLAVIPRYLITSVTLTGLFAIVAIVGWRELPRADPRRAPWAAGASVLAIMLALTVPALVTEDRWVVTLLHQQRAITDDLHTLAASPALRRRGHRIVHIPTRRAVPLLAAWSDLPLDALSADEPPPGVGSLVIRPATLEISDMVYSSTTPHWSSTQDASVSWHELYRNGSWVLYRTVPHSNRRAREGSLVRGVSVAEHSGDPHAHARGRR